MYSCFAQSQRRFVTPYCFLSSPVPLWIVSCWHTSLLQVATTASLNVPMKDNEDVELYCGKPNEPGIQNGIVTSACFHSPMALWTWDQLWFCATLEIAIRLIGNAGPPRKLSFVVFSYAQLFDLDHYRGKPRKTFQEALTVEKLVEFFLWRGESKLDKGLAASLLKVPIKSFHIALVGRLCWCMRVLFV